MVSHSRHNEYDKSPRKRSPFEMISGVTDDAEEKKAWHAMPAPQDDSRYGTIHSGGSCSV